MSARKKKKSFDDVYAVQSTLAHALTKDIGNRNRPGAVSMRTGGHEALSSGGCGLDGLGLNIRRR
jgi:hypothetical protein